MLKTMENLQMNSTDELFSEQQLPNPDLLGQTEDTYSSMMHSSQLAGMFVPGLGLIAPIGLWIYGKDKSETVNRHGLHIINWMISLYILMFVVFCLCFVFVGLFIMPFLLLTSLIFPIIGAVKASNGKEWKYPLSFQFFKA